MRKPLVIGTIVVLIASAAPSASQPRLERFEFPPSSADASVLADARIGAIKAVLNLNPAQEKLWPPVESALRELFRSRFEQKMFARTERPGDVLEKLRRKSEIMSAKSAVLKKLLDAAEPLHQGLDEAQKQRLGTLFRMQVARRMKMNER